MPVRPMQTIIPKLIRDTDVAAMLACSRSTVWRRVADGTLPGPLKFGRISRWRTEDVTQAIRDAEVVRGEA